MRTGEVTTDVRHRRAHRLRYRFDYPPRGLRTGWTIEIDEGSGERGEFVTKFLDVEHGLFYHRRRRNEERALTSPPDLFGPLPPNFYSLLGCVPSPDSLALASFDRIGQALIGYWAG